MFAKAKKLSEEDFEKMDDQADDEWKQDELQEPEPETQALEVPGEGYQEDEFEEVFEELEEAQQARIGKHPLFTTWINAEHELINQAKDIRHAGRQRMPWGTPSKQNQRRMLVDSVPKRRKQTMSFKVVRWTYQVVGCQTWLAFLILLCCTAQLQSWKALGCLGGCRAGLISHSKKVQPSPPKRQRQETPQTQACNACDEFSCTCEHPGLVDASLNIFLIFLKSHTDIERFETTIDRIDRSTSEMQFSW